MELNEQNYFSQEANREYMSNSQYKNFLNCEAMAMASILGEYTRPTSNEFLAGSFVHAWNESPKALEAFRANTPEMFNKNGTMKAAFVFAETMIETLKNDAICSYMLEGEKEVIMTAEMFGAPWKIKIDTYKPDDSIVDLKTTRSIWELQWDSFYKSKVSFIEMYRYFTQFAIYLEVERLAHERDFWLSPYIVAVSKETPPDKAVIDLTDDIRIKYELDQIEAHMPRIIAVKSGLVEPEYCGHCAYCRSVRQVTDIISYKDLEGGAV